MNILEYVKKREKIFDEMLILEREVTGAEWYKERFRHMVVEWMLKNYTLEQVTREIAYYTIRWVKQDKDIIKGFKSELDTAWEDTVEKRCGKKENREINQS